MLRLLGDHNDDDYYEDDVGVDKTSSFPSDYTSFCLVSGILRACPLCLLTTEGEGPPASNVTEYRTLRLPMSESTGITNFSHLSSVLMSTCAIQHHLFVL